MNLILDTGILGQLCHPRHPKNRPVAELWAKARSQGTPTTDKYALDGDVILAAQVESVGGIVVTNNPKHLSRFVEARNWSQISSQE